MKKKIIALALAAVMVVLTLGLASCTGGITQTPQGKAARTPPKTAL